MGLHDGVIYLAMDMGDGEKVDLIGGSGRRFDDDVWHDIIIERETRSVSVDYQQRCYLPVHAINIPTMQLFTTIPRYSQGVQGNSKIIYGEILS